MKKIITLAVLGMLGAVPVSAQTVYDAANIANKDLNGTARFVSCLLYTSDAADE